MKIHFFKYFILPLAGLLFAGCEKEVKNVDLPPFEQMLAIASFISPTDSGTYIFVSSNRKLYGELGIDEQTGNLSGTISDGSGEADLETVSNGLYVSSERMPVQYGKTYNLKISSDKGLTAEALCTVPEKRDFDLSIDSVSYIEHKMEIGENIYYVYYTMELLFSLADYAGENNFYRLIMKKTVYKTDPYTGKSYRYDNYFYTKKEYFSDSGMDGRRIYHNGSTNTSTDNYSGYDSAFVKIYLYNTEKSYYLYHTSLRNYNDDENPFTEVTPVFSNIKGGLGIFTSYTVDSLIFRLK